MIKNEEADDTENVVTRLSYPFGNKNIYWSRKCVIPFKCDG